MCVIDSGVRGVVSESFVCIYIFWVMVVIYDYFMYLYLLYKSVYKIIVWVFKMV